LSIHAKIEKEIIRATSSGLWFFVVITLVFIRLNF